MNALVELDIAEQRMEEAFDFYKQTLKRVRRELMDKRLTFKEVAQLTEYDKSYLYRLDIPFDHNDVITYNRLERWIENNKPNRLKRLRKNFKQRFAT